ncbi:MAG: NAD(P)H-dependent oxidoreductase [Acetobacteraceae bacterium]
MNLARLLARRLENAGPIRIGLIGAGKFGSMFLAQVPSCPGLTVAGIADLSPDRARAACRATGWDEALIEATLFTDDAASLIGRPEIEIVVEATGHPAAGIRHARAAIGAGKHIVMVNVEADALAGPLLAREAEAAGVVYSLAYGDQPALICELVDWARAAGFRVLAAGKGTKYLPAYHASTPETVWEHYGLSAEQARAGGMNAKMFNSFLDGTKSAIEMAAVANATGLAAPPGGLGFPPAAATELASVLGSATGEVEVVSSLHRNGEPVANDLRWGVYVVFEAPGAYTARCFGEYGVATDPTGTRAALYRPSHLIGLELGISIISAVLRREPTGAPERFRADVIATAKKAHAAGARLDGEGGGMVWGKLVPAEASLAQGGLPIGLASGLVLRRPVPAGRMLSWEDVMLDPAEETWRYRQRMEAAFAP